MINAVMMPRIGLNETENMLGEVYVNEGDKVADGDELFSVETDKSSLSVYAETSGTVLKIFYDSFEAVEVLTPVCVIGEPGEDFSEFVPSENEGKSEAETQDKSDSKLSQGSVESPTVIDDAADFDGIIRISPRAKRLAESNGIDFSRLRPGGAENRIIESDIIAAMAGEAVYIEAQTSNTVKFTNIRKIIADNMMNSLHNTAQLTNHCSFDAGRIMSIKDDLKARGKKITIGDLILFGLSKTLRENSEINAHMIGDDEIAVFENVNIGLAVDTPRGLMVPTIMNADSLSIDDIAKESRALAEECRSGSISPEKLKGATFTVSNLGSFGVQYFTPILNPPQIGILGVGAIDYKVRKTANGMEFYPAGYLSLTYDHRAIDGAPASRFLKALCDNLENIQIKD